MAIVAAKSAYSIRSWPRWSLHKRNNNGNIFFLRLPHRDNSILNQIRVTSN
jgi:hypothetical protein